MTLEQFASRISQFPFLASIAVIGIGLLLGLLLAWLFWRRRHRSWREAVLRQKKLASESTSYESRSRYFKSLMAERQKLAAEMDWSKFDFVSPELAVKLKEYGVKDLGNLNSLSASQRSQLDSKLAAGGLSLNWDAVEKAKASLELAKNGLAQNGLAQNFDVDWNNVEGVDLKTAGELKRLGIKNIGELESMSPAERTKLEAELKQKGVAWDWGKLGGWKTALGGAAAGVTGLTAGIANLGTGAIDKAGDALGAVGNSVNGANASVAGAKDLAGGTFPNTLVDAKLDSNADADVDWGKVKGVDLKTAGELKRLGIKNIGELESMAPAERTKFEAELKQKGVAWDWGKLGGWKTALGGAAAGVTGLTAGIANVGTGAIDKAGDALGAVGNSVGNGANASVAGTKDLAGGTFPNTRVDAKLDSNADADVDWGKVKGVDLKTAGELKRLGIKNIGELESMSPAERTKFEAELKQKGVAWDWGKLGGWKTALGGAAAGVTGLTAGIANLGTGVIDKAGDALGVVGNSVNGANASVAGGKDLAGGTFPNPRVDAKLDSNADADVDWGKVKGVDLKTAGELKRLGIKNIGELESMSPAERTKFEAELKQKGVAWDWGKLGNWKTALGQQSHLKGPHFGRSDAQVAGVAPAIADASKSSIAATNQGATGAAAALGATAAGITAAGTSGAGATAGLGLSEASGSINVDGVVAQDLQRTEPPRLFESAPQWRDDLTLLDGIDDLQSRELRKMGIYNFEQLHNLPALEQARLQAWFGSKGWHLEMNQWRISSEGNTLNPSTESIQNKAYEAYCHRRDHHLCGDQSTDWEQAEWEMRGNPIWGYGVPHDVEDYCQSLEGVTEEARNELYRMGLYNRHQVELLNEPERRLLTSWFAGPRFGVDLTKAFGWLSTLKPAPADLDFGDICESEPQQIDDLSRIKGIGNAAESDLNRIGIYHFSQIANWTSENSAAIAVALGLEDRIERDSWIEQAKMFSQRGT